MSEPALQKFRGFARRRRPLLVCFCFGLACSSPSASNAEPERSPETPRVVPIARDVAYPTPRTEDGGTPIRLEHIATIEDLVALVTTRTFWPMDLGGAEKRLSAWGPTRRERSNAISDADKLRFGITDVPDDITLVAGPSGILQRAEVSYVGGTDRAAFRSAGFSLTADSVVVMHQRIRVLVSAKLGNANWVNEHADKTPAVMGWKLRGKLELVLRAARSAGQSHVELSISTPEGP